MGLVQCPVCLTPTTISVGLSPTRTPFHVREAEFERAYQRREEQRISEGHLAPEALGKHEAKQIIDLERCLADDGP